MANLVLSLTALFVLSLLLPGRRTTAALGIWLLWLGAWMACNLWLFSHHYFGNQSAPIFAATTILLVHILRRSWRLNRLLQGLGGRAPLQSTGQEIEATILFTNLPESIKELESTDPEEALARRAAHSKCVGYAVNQYGGRLVDLQGDAQMIAFGLEGGRHEVQAVACAQEIVKRVNLLLNVAEGSPPHVFCGIVTGRVAIGQVGGGDYRGVAAIGDTTNSAARLMGQAKKQSKPILISSQTAGALGTRAVTEVVGELKVKGREEPLKVAEVISFETPEVKPVEVRSVRSRQLLKWGIVLGTTLSLVFSYFLSDEDFIHLTLLDLVTPTHREAPILVAGLDEESLQFGDWPWPRSLHARAVDNCVRAGAACVFLDLLFEDPTDSSDDKQLVDAILERENVIVGAAAVADPDGTPLPPVLLPGIAESSRWGLINHAPRNGEDALRWALWELPTGGGSEPQRLPGVAQRVIEVVEPQKAGSLEGKDDFLIRWGPQPTTVSYFRLLNPADPIFKSMKGKIVIVGDNLSGGSDAFQTPVGLMKGAHIHAQSIQTVLSGQLLSDQSRGALAFILSGLCAVFLIFLSWRTFGLLGQVSLLALGSAGATLMIFLFARAGVFLGGMPLVTSVIAVLVGWLIAVIDTKKLLTNYIPSRLQEKLERDGTVADLTTEGTILLTDIRGYTTLSEGRSPHEILTLLNSYHEKTAAIYAKYGGHLLTYQGDAQIVVFGPLEPLENPVRSAMLSALELEPVVKQVAQEAGLEEGVLRVGSGVTTGKITLSLMGVAGQLQYSVFGAPVREAHHLQSLSDELDSPVILDHRSYLLLRDQKKLRKRKTDTGETVYVPASKTV